MLGKTTSVLVCCISDDKASKMDNEPLKEISSDIKDIKEKYVTINYNYDQINRRLTDLEDNSDRLSNIGRNNYCLYHSMYI